MKIERRGKCDCREFHQPLNLSRNRGRTGRRGAAPARTGHRSAGTGRGAHAPAAAKSRGSAAEEQQSASAARMATLILAQRISFRYRLRS